ncbi:MAG: hypothetical protein Kow0092_12250 [Deferrisomatales bacterium]
MRPRALAGWVVALLLGAVGLAQAGGAGGEVGAFLLLGAAFTAMQAVPPLILLGALGVVFWRRRRAMGRGAAWLREAA